MSAFCSLALRLYVPEFASSLSVSVAGCSSEEGTEMGNCFLVLRLGSASLQQGPITMNCSGFSCSAALSNPPWDTWIRVVIESTQANRTVTFSVVSNYTGEFRNMYTEVCTHITPVFEITLYSLQYINYAVGPKHPPVP